MIVGATPPAWRVWWKIARENTTLLRSLENQCVRSLVLEGDTLDIGGGPDFDYVKHMRVTGKLVSANLAAELRPDLLVDLNQPLPLARATFDNVVSFNTLEHVYEERQLLAEMLRVLKPGGTFVISVPFLFRRHGNYGDFHRHTADYWENTLTGLGVPSADFVVQPLVWSPLTSALTSMPWFRGGFSGRALKLLAMSFELLAAMLPGDRARKRERYGDWALSFFIRGRRPR